MILCFVLKTVREKDTEIIESREKTKTEYEKKIRSIQKDIDMNDELKERVKQLENELKGIIDFEIFCF